MKEMVVFIDGPNFFKGWWECYHTEPDYEIVCKMLTQKWKIRNIFMYQTFKPGEKRKFYLIKKLQSYNCKIRAIDLKQTDEEIWKGDVDSEMLVEIPFLVSRYNPQETEIILVSGDSDFVSLVKMLRIRGFIVTVMAFSKTLSNELINEADNFLYIEELLKKVEIENKKIVETEIEKIKDELNQTTKPNQGILKLLKKINPLGS